MYNLKISTFSGEFTSQIFFTLNYEISDSK